MRQIPECPKRLPARIGEMIRELGGLWATSDVCPRIATATKTAWNAMLREWIDDCSIPLFVRKSSLVGGSLIEHASGRKIVPTDNSPAQWACHLALCDQVPPIQEIRDDFAAIPASFALRALEKDRCVYNKTLGKYSVNKAGWKLCHIFAVGLKTKAFLDQMDIADLKRAFFRLLSPSNYFLLPMKWGGLGETDEFIEGFLEGLKATPDYVCDPVLQELTKFRDIRSAMQMPSNGIVPAANAQYGSGAVTAYPLSECGEHIQRIATKPSECDRRWVGNDASNCNYSSRVPLGTITLYLWWKAGPDSTPDEIKDIGAFRLDLEKLLEGKYVRWEDEKERIVRLRFRRASDNIIYIQTKTDEPRIAVGAFP
jgi:hypothetical protein